MVTMKPVKSMEIATEKALLIVRITNKDRLNADVTEDFFLVGRNDFFKATDALDGYEDFYFIEDVEAVLNANGVCFEHIVDGQRFYFGENIEEEIVDQE